MLNKPDIASVSSVTRIAPVTAVDAVGTLIQALGGRAASLVQGQEYAAQVLSKLSDSTYTVKVAGADSKEIVLKMHLGSASQAGQALLLRYLHDNPNPTFLLLPASNQPAQSTADISPAAQLIGQILSKAESDGVPARFEAAAVVSHAPLNTQVMVQDLKHAVNQSGLFYESHLSDLLQGNQTLAAIRQEPQNQANTALAGLVSQQLAVLENQRMSWQGEIWPGQKMHWDVYLPQKDHGKQAASSMRQAEEKRPIASEMTLHLPSLGKVSARLSIIDGRMRIGILAEQTQTLTTLKTHSATLAKAFEKNGQALDRLSISRHE